MRQTTCATALAVAIFASASAMAQDAPMNSASVDPQADLPRPTRPIAHRCVALQFSNCHWVQRPTGDDFAAAYPAHARTHSISGAAIIRCGVKPDGWLTDCKVIDEAPPGEEFGKATLLLSRRMRIQMDDRSAIPAGTITSDIPIRFLIRR